MEERESMNHPSGLPPEIQVSGEEVGNAGGVEKLGSYLNLAKYCMEVVQKNSSPKFNKELCGYLVEKLEVVIQSASLFLEVLQAERHEPCSSVDIERWIEIFKLLLALAKQIESFIQGCCKDEWMQAAMTLSNVSEYVSSLGFNLELCRVAFCIQCSATDFCLTLVEVDVINEAEVEAIKLKASADMESLLKIVAMQLDSPEDRIKDLAKYLLQRLVRVGPHPTSKEGSFLGKLFEWVTPSTTPMQLGKGSSATVYKVDWLGTPVAKKTFFGPENPDFTKEVDILSRLCHPNITSMFCCTMNKRSCSIIMELMDGNLHDMMQRRLEENIDRPPFPILEAIDIMLQIGEGVNYLHNRHIIHMSMNILVKSVTASKLASKLETGYVVAKVVDFGLSRTKERSTNMTCNMGTWGWMAPEVINLIAGSTKIVAGSAYMPKHKFKSDIYSFAIVCYEILTGKVPFEREKTPRIVKEKVIKGERPKLPDHWPSMLKALIEKCWCQYPAERPTFDDICQKLKYFKYLLMTSDILARFGDGVGTNQRKAPAAGMEETMSSNSEKLQHSAILSSENFSSNDGEKLLHSAIISSENFTSNDGEKLLHSAIISSENFTSNNGESEKLQHSAITALENTACNKSENEVVMAEALLVGAAVGAVVSALLDEVIDAAKNAIRCKENCDNLLSTLQSVKPLLDSITQSSDSENATCQAWLSDVHSLLLEAKHILGKCTVRNWSFRFVHVKKWHLSSSIKDVDRQIKVKLPEANLLALDILQMMYKITTDQSVRSQMVDKPTAFEMQPVPDNIVEFERNPFKKLKELIATVADAPSGDPMTIGLKGRVGAGKTLLAKMVNNDKDIQDMYGAGSILWITIGNNASVSSAYITMGKFLKDSGVFERDYARRNLEDQRRYLMEAFKAKRILLILDDVWENSCNSRAMIDWLDVCKGLGSATLITTRNESVLVRAKAEERIEVPTLSADESWKLFCFHAFQTSIPPSGHLEYLAREICDECKGLPLALEFLGSTLRGKKDESDWRIALCGLERPGAVSKSIFVDDVLGSLKLSYDALEEDTKKCFLYCAAFPEDYEIPTDKLCSIWQAEELFGSYDAEDAIYMGRIHLIALADRSLINLTEDGRFVKVHDVLRDFAIRIIFEAGVGEWASECHFVPRKLLRAFPTMNVTAKRVSLVGSTLKLTEPQSNLQVPHLQVCIFSNISNLSNGGREIPLVFSKGFFCGMTNLLYLDLSRCDFLDELPESIKELKSLRHLDLSWCRFLKELPETIGELKSLLHLDLSWCRFLKKLPENIKELKFLTHLDLSWCKYLKELQESITELNSLTHLNLSGCKSSEELPESIKGLKSLTHLNLP